MNLARSFRKAKSLPFPVKSRPFAFIYPGVHSFDLFLWLLLQSCLGLLPAALLLTSASNPGFDSHSQAPQRSAVFTHSTLFGILSGITPFLCLIPTSLTDKNTFLFIAVCTTSATHAANAFSKYLYDRYRLFLAF